MAKKKHTDDDKHIEPIESAEPTAPSTATPTVPSESAESTAPTESVDSVDEESGAVDTNNTQDEPKPTKKAKQAKAKSEDMLIPIKAGERLSQARIDKGFSLAELAAQTNIAKRYLRAIEESAFDKIYGSTYVVGFARSYARAVGLPEQEIAEAIKQELSQAQYGQQPPYQAYQPVQPEQLPSNRMVKISVAIGVLLIIGYAVWRYATPDVSTPQLLSEQARSANTQAETNSPTDTTAGTAGIAGTANTTDTADTLDTTETTQTAETSEGIETPRASTISLLGVEETWIGFEDENGELESDYTLRANETYNVPASYVQRLTLRTAKPHTLHVFIDGQRVRGQLGRAETMVRIALDPNAIRTRMANYPESSPESN